MCAFDCHVSSFLIGSLDSQYSEFIERGMFLGPSEAIFRRAAGESNWAESGDRAGTSLGHDGGFAGHRNSIHAGRDLLPGPPR